MIAANDCASRSHIDRAEVRTPDREALPVDYE